MSYYELPKELDREFERFCENIRDFKEKKLDPVAFKTIRVPFGVYEQRTADTYMVRVRLTGGKASATQLLGLCSLADRYALGSLHITTRGDAQLHNVALDDIERVIAGLHSVGVSSRGGGGNTLRNVTADSYSKAPDSLFDVSVHASLLTTKLLKQKDSFTLPRKYKIAFSSSAADRANATISDLGFIAQIRDGKRGFGVWCAGGMGAKSRLGQKLFEFIDESEIFIVSEAVKKVFDTHGNRRKKHANRLRFLVEELGFGEFEKLVNIEIEALAKEEESYIRFDDALFADSVFEDAAIEDEDTALFAKRFAKEQSNGAQTLKIPLELGDIRADALREIVSAAKAFGEDIFRFGNDQNLYLYDIPKNAIGSLHKACDNASALTKAPQIIGDVISCAGASTCRLGIGLSRGASEAISRHLLQSALDLDAFAGFKIHISGCPNSCGKHPIADLGFYGKAGRFEGRLYPAYVVVVGAKVSQGESRFAKSIGEVPAYRLPALVEAVLKATPPEFADRFYEWADANEASLRAIVESLNTIASFRDDKNPYYDFGAEELFSLKDRGEGECSAGMFDLIDSDQKRAKKIVAELQNGYSEELKNELLLVSARMLLITRGEEAREASGVYEAFYREFAKTALVSQSGVQIAEKLLNGQIGEVSVSEALSFSEAVFGLYAKMDHTLKFAVETEAPKQVENVTKEAKEALQEDFRGVPCPMNFVKTKMALAKISANEALEVLLSDGSPIENVPNSVKAEGHTIESITKERDYWRVRIIKK